MNKLTYFYILALLLIGVFACKKDTDISGPDPLITNIEMGNIVTVNLMGTVFDEDFKVLSNVKVVIGNKQFYTDENGVFIAPNVSLYSKVGHLKFEKPGYFNLPKSISVGSSQDYSIQVMMKKRNLTETFNGATGGTVTQEAVTLDFPANALVTEQGTVYTGQVRAYVTNFNPDDATFSYNMPGILIGEREDESAAVLETYGMIVVELEGSQGQKLQVAEGKTVKTVYQIPASSKSFAPAEMPLWSMRANDPFWREEGFAVREGDTYVAELHHFSFVNYDVPQPRWCNISFTLIDRDGNPFGNQLYNILIVGQNIVVASFTDANGYAEATVPANTIMELVLYNSCLQIHTVTTFGPFTGASENNLGIFEVTDLLVSNSVTVTGYLEDCDQQPLSNGYVSVSNIIGISNTIMPDANGNFSFTQLVCSGSGGFNLFALDFDAGIYSDVYNITAASGIVNLDTISLCTPMEEYYVSFSIDGGDTYTISDSISAKLLISQITGYESLIISASDSMPPFLNDVLLQILTENSISDLVNNITYVSNSSLWISANINIDGELYYTLEEPGSIHFSAIGGIGTVIEGTFNGTVYEEQTGTGISYPATISFKVLVF